MTIHRLATAPQLAPNSLSEMCLGIDASNIRDGGGLGNISEILRVAQPEEFGIRKIIVWGGRLTLDRLPDRPWLECQHDPLLDQSLPIRTYWQIRKLPALAQEKCDCLFIPGGYYTGSFRPFVVLSQNMLPFEYGEIWRYGVSGTSARFLLLRLAQSRSFRRADGAIFLSQYARSEIRRIARLKGHQPIIPQGVNSQFFLAPRAQKPIQDYSIQRPFKLLYVSKLELYKHHWNVVEAVAQLRRAGLPVTLDLIGGPDRPQLTHRLLSTIKRVDADNSYIRYYGHMSCRGLIDAYHEADGFIFASSCENLPNILLEAMAAGLPIACAGRGPMPEVLGEAGVYFDPLEPKSIAAAVRRMVEDEEWRGRVAQEAYERAQAYSWERCARETFSFLAEVTARATGRTAPKNTC